MLLIYAHWAPPSYSQLFSNYATKIAWTVNSKNTASYSLQPVLSLCALAVQAETRLDLIVSCLKQLQRKHEDVRSSVVRCGGFQAGNKRYVGRHYLLACMMVVRKVACRSHSWINCAFTCDFSIAIKLLLDHGLWSKSSHAVNLTSWRTAKCLCHFTESWFGVLTVELLSFFWSTTWLLGLCTWEWKIFTHNPRCS